MIILFISSPYQVPVLQTLTLDHWTNLTILSTTLHLNLSSKSCTALRHLCCKVTTFFSRGCHSSLHSMFNINHNNINRTVVLHCDCSRRRIGGLSSWYDGTDKSNCTSWESSFPASGPNVGVEIRGCEGVAMDFLVWLYLDASRRAWKIVGRVEEDSLGHHISKLDMDWDKGFRGIACHGQKVWDREAKKSTWKAH